jgi:hypothetical protein
MIVDADFYKANGDDGEEKIERVYRAYVLLNEAIHEAKYNEEITELSHVHDLNPSTGDASFGISKSVFRGKTFGHKEFGKSWSIKKEDPATSKVIA